MSLANKLLFGEKKSYEVELCIYPDLEMIQRKRPTKEMGRMKFQETELGVGSKLLGQ